MIETNTNKSYVVKETEQTNELQLKNLSFRHAAKKNLPKIMARLNQKKKKRMKT
jgi:hypothetical protein